MSKRFSFGAIVVFLVSFHPALAQNSLKPWSLDEIISSSRFSFKSLDRAQWIQGGKRFSYLELDSITGHRDLYTYAVASGKRELVMNGSLLVSGPRGQPMRIGSYEWSSDGGHILITGTLPARRTKTGGDFGVFDVKSKTFRMFGNQGKDLAIIKFSPDGSKVGFVRSNNLFVIDLSTGKETQLTFDGSENVINGKFDWVYEEEFEIIDGWQWSPDGKSIAFWRLDQSRVPTFPLVRYPGDDSHADVQLEHYPKAGDPNSIVKIGVVNIETHKTVWVNIGDNQDIYVPRIKWTNDPQVLSVQRLNRRQDTLDLMLANVATGSVTTILTETDSAWVDVNDDLTFLKKSRQFLWTSSRDGFRHIYLYNLDGSMVRQLTRGEWEVTHLEGVDERDKTVYFVGTEASPLERTFYSVHYDDSKLKRLSSVPGWHSVSMSPDCSVYLDTYSSFGNPPNVILADHQGRNIAVIIANSSDVFSEYPVTRHTFFSFRTSDGMTLNGWMITPPGFDSTRRYPVLMYAYGVGHQTVTNQWGGRNYLWYQLLAQKGYIISSVDNRGTEGRGRKFRQASYRHLGVPETKDQIEAVKYLSSLSYIDSTRVGMWGASGGGYMTLMAMTFGARYFKTGIAVAAVSHFKFYDSIWTERYMGLPQDNMDGYKETSPITYVSNLKGNLLIIHGTVDDNVHWQNSVVFVDELIKSNKQVHTMFYPGRSHGIYGGNATLHWFTLMTNYLLENL